MNLYEVMVQREDSKVKLSVYVVARDLKHAQEQVDHMNNTISPFNLYTQEVYSYFPKGVGQSVEFTLTEDTLEGFGEMSELPNIH